jgi:hypothetical protein
MSSSTTMPIVPPALGVVVRDGAALTDTVSCPQALEAGLLLVSPL